ncbi:hypothetical protein BDQ12DRAFT_733867 [Crucibulum laeve]|uniref:DUF6533 domain-containing protein n=1 Tax=Crucibulum laeve TaxID=68775 RepID=A0A5C3M715_9AGAR|nr:hypothetical protein BDQ12DRAFT_733867 [Crucibulum laeve]
MHHSVSTLEATTVAFSCLQVGRYSAVAAYALQIYEFFLCIDEEILLIHKARWSSMKVAYIVCRFYPLFLFPFYLWCWLGNHTRETCHKLIPPIYALLVGLPLSAQAVILIRTVAFIGGTAFTLATLLPFYLSLVGAEIWLFGTRFTVSEDLYMAFGPGHPTKSGCYANDGHPLETVTSGGEYPNIPPTAGVLLAIFIFDLVMMAIILIHYVRTQAVRGKLGKAFVTHSFTAFSIISVVYLFTSCLYFSPYRRWDGLGLPVVLVLPDVIACRLILSLRRTVDPTDTYILQENSRLVDQAFDKIFQTCSSETCLA